MITGLYWFALLVVVLEVALGTESGMLVALAMGVATWLGTTYSPPWVIAGTDWPAGPGTRPAANQESHSLVTTRTDEDRQVVAMYSCRRL